MTCSLSRFALPFAVLLVGLVVAAGAEAATRIDLDAGWQFRTDPEGAGEAAGWAAAAPADTDSVEVPHTWNVGKYHDYLGVAWYFRRFPMPPRTLDGHVELHFGATFYRARVWLNGTEIGRHEGGFTAYAFDVTHALKRSNLLVVELDNRPAADTIPGFGARENPTSWYDWWDYGGLVRDVWLTSAGPVWVRRERIRTEPAATGATVQARVFIENALPTHAPVVVRATAFGPDGHADAAATGPVTLNPGANEVALSLTLAAPRLWGIDHPDVYRLDIAVEDRAGKPLDEHSDTFGVRTIEIRERHLLINGERVRLTGMARHEDSPWEGLAETRGTMQYDYDDMKALQTTLTRPVHYPQNPFILDYADRHGIVLIPEIPVWQFNEAQLSNPRVLELAKQQMREMIEQAGNHPSIFAWSVMNESAAGTAAGIAYFRAMRDFIHQIDPGRYVSFADDNLAKLDRAEQSAANDADFLLMNQYYGSWHGPASALVPALDKVNQMFPDKMVIISEMGFAGIFARNPVAADQARITTIREQMPILAGRDWIAGALLWCYQDYKSRRNLWPGQTEGFVEHGVVDENRQRKPSYAVWQEVNAPARLEASWTRGAAGEATGFTATLTPNTVQNLPFYPLHDYRLAWSALDGKGKAIAGGEQRFAELAEPASATVELPAGVAATLARLTLRFYRPTGGLAAERVLEWTPAAASAKP
jgi:hypothetical protein